MNLTNINVIIENYLLSLEYGIYKYKDLFNPPKKYNNNFEEFIKLKNNLPKKEFEMYLRNKVCDLKKKEKIISKNAFIIVSNGNIYEKFLNKYFFYVENNKIKGNKDMCFDIKTIFYMNLGNGILNKSNIYMSNSFLKENNFYSIKPIISFFFKHITFVDDDNIVEYATKEFLANNKINKNDINTFIKFTQENDIDVFKVFEKYLKKLNKKQTNLFSQNLKFLLIKKMYDK